MPPRARGLRGRVSDMSSRSSAGERQRHRPGCRLRGGSGPRSRSVRYPGTDSPPGGDRSRARRQTDSVSALRTWLGDPYLVRRVTYGAAGGAAASSRCSPRSLARGRVYAVSAVVSRRGGASLPSRRWRATVLAAGPCSSRRARSATPRPCGSPSRPSSSAPSPRTSGRPRGWAGRAALLGPRCCRWCCPRSRTSRRSSRPSSAEARDSCCAPASGPSSSPRRRRSCAARPRGSSNARTGARAPRRRRAPGHGDRRPGRGGPVSDPDRALRSIGDLGRTALGELDALVVHLRDPSAALTVSAPPRLLDIEELLAEPLRRQGVAVSVRLDAGAGPGRGRRADRLPDRAGGADQRGPARPGEARLGRAGPGRRRVRLRVSDDGVGPAHVPGRDSGLLGIEERVSARGGTWEISERPGGGTILDVHLPVGRRDRRHDPGGRRRRPAAGARRFRADPRLPARHRGRGAGGGRTAVPGRRARRPASRRGAGGHPDAGARRAGGDPRAGGGAARTGGDRGDHVRRRRLRARRDRGRGARVPAQAVQRPGAGGGGPHRRGRGSRSSPPR